MGMTITGEGDAPFIIGAMFTPNYAEKANRLISSCRNLALPFEIREVQGVHWSISASGCDDPGLTKANLIRSLLDKHRKPVLYIDADCEVISRPVLIEESDCDFAIYNWMADDYRDRFVPVDYSPGNIPPKPHRFFKFHGALDFHSKDQLIAAGCTQYYANTTAARDLLAAWQKTIETFPRSGDDDCLDYTFNNLDRDLLSRLKVRWLPKEYARYVFWIYVQPVINHPDIPAPTARFTQIRCPNGRKRLYPERTEKRKITPLFPRDAVIDTQDELVGRFWV